MNGWKRKQETISTITTCNEGPLSSSKQSRISKVHLHQVAEGKRRALPYFGSAGEEVPCYPGDLSSFEAPGFGVVEDHIAEKRSALPNKNATT